MLLVPLIALPPRRLCGANTTTLCDTKSSAPVTWRGSGAAEPLETVEDEIESPYELEGGVVSGPWEPRYDLGEVGVVVECADRLPPPPCGVSGRSGCLEAEIPLLQGEAVDVCVLGRVSVDCPLERETGLAQAAHYRIVVLQVRRPRVPRLHHPYRPSVGVQRCACRHRSVSHGGPPVMVR